MRLSTSTGRFSHIGKGALYPFGFTEEGGVACDDANEGEVIQVKKRINGSIHYIMETMLGGDRYRRPTWGCRLTEAVFEQNDDVLQDILELYIRESIVQWEKRIVVTSISFSYPANDTSGHTILMTVNYFIIAYQVEGNYVYPFVRSR